jgi:hypothetical protein
MTNTPVFDILLAVKRVEVEKQELLDAIEEQETSLRRYMAEKTELTAIQEEAYKMRLYAPEKNFGDAWTIILKRVEERMG